MPVPIVYGGMRLEEKFRAGLIVEGTVILERKAVEPASKVQATQLFTNLKLKGLSLGFVLDFGSNLMRDGIERIANGLKDEKLGVFA